MILKLFFLLFTVVPSYLTWQLLQSNSLDWFLCFFFFKRYWLLRFFFFLTPLISLFLCFFLFFNAIYFSVWYCYYVLISFTWHPLVGLLWYSCNSYMVIYLFVSFSTRWLFYVIGLVKASTEHIFLLSRPFLFPSQV